MHFQSSSPHKPAGRMAVPPTPHAERLDCHFLAVAVYTSHGCRNVQEIAVEVSEISRREVAVCSPLCLFLPDAFTLVLGLRQYGMGCSVVRRRADRILCRLIRPESTDLVAFLSKVEEPKATLRELKHPLFPRSRMAKSYVYM